MEKNWKKILPFLIITLIFVSGCTSNKQTSTPKTFSSDDVIVTIDKTVYRQNEEILLKVEPSIGYQSVLKYRDAMNFGSYHPDGKQKLRTYSYGPGIAYIEIWKLDENGTINFYTKNDKNELIPNQPVLKFQIKIEK